MLLLGGYEVYSVRSGIGRYVDRKATGVKACSGGPAYRRRSSIPKIDAFRLR